MSNLIDSPEFTANEIYQIAAADPVEGAQSGASDGGIGIDNQPHQQLANRTAFLRGRQDTNIANIGVLQAFAAKFVSSMAANGYLKLAAADVALGAIQPIVQWGFYSWIGKTAAALKNAAWGPIAFPCPGGFPNQALIVVPQLATNSFSAPGALGSAALALELGNITKTGFTAFSDWNDNGTINVAQSVNDGNGFTGFYWFAIGY
ncbi:MAG: hypothetical protein ACREQI_14095 [Candidatus Binataceae bacterium]